MTIIRFLICIKSCKNGFLHQLDINTAFLQVDLEEETYMKIPYGLKVSNKNHICKLNQSIYGLKQAKKPKNNKLISTLLEFVSTKSKFDYSLFTKKTNNYFTDILGHDDDLILTGNNMPKISHIKSIINTNLKFLRI